MRKRLMMTTAMLLLSLFTSVALWANDTSGTVGDNITWTLDDQGTLTFTGSGEIPDYTSSSLSPWRKNADIKKIVFDPNITRIGSYAFTSCKGLESIDFGNSGGKATKLESIGQRAFAECGSAAAEFDLTIPSGVTTIEYNAFYACVGLQNVTLPKTLTTLENPFNMCHNLKTITMLATTPPTYFNLSVSTDVPLYIPLDAAKAYMHSEACSDYKKRFRIKDKRVYATTRTVSYHNLTLTLYYDNKVGVYEDDDLSVYESGDTFNGKKLREDLNCDTWLITTVDFDESIADYHPTTCEYWFCDFTGLKTINNLDRVDTKNVKSMRCMFYSCESLQSLPDFSKFNTANVENMELMFGVCKSLDNPNLKGLDTSNATSMDGMFQKCSGMKTLDLTPLNTEKVTSMYAMFDGCTSLENLNLSSLNTANVEDMRLMFRNCTGLRSLDLRSFDTAKMNLCIDMFSGATALKDIYVSDKFVTTASCTSNSRNMFNNCNALPYSYGTIERANYNTDEGNFKKAVATLGGGLVGARGKELTVDELNISGDKEFVLLTETDDAAVKINKGTYTRTMTSKWGTICLPYCIDIDATAYNLYAPAEITDDAIELNIWSGRLYAGIPAIVYRKASSATLSFTGGGWLSYARSNGLITGTFTTTTLDDTDYFIAGDAFRRVSDYTTGTAKGVKVAPYHAYIEGAQTSAQTASVLRLMGGETTGIDNTFVNDLNDDTAEFYTPDGRRTDGLQKGLNIMKVGGKTRKVIVR